MEDKQYLVIIDLPSDFKWFTTKSKREHIAHLFGEAFLMDADANLEIDNVIINITKNMVIFDLVQQTVDEPNGDFTKENIIKVLEYVKNDKNIDYSFTIGEIPV